MYNPLFTGKVLLELNEVDSTNNYARYWISNNKPIEGTVIIAQNQFAGKGQFGKTWVSEPGKNLTCSIIYYPVHLKVEEAFVLIQISSLALCNTLSQFGVQNPQIKWPNDILVNNKKMAGILIENSIRNNHFQDSIIGIGVNLNQENFDALPNITSVKNITGNNISAQEFCQVLFSYLEMFYLQSKNLSKFQQDFYEQYSSKIFRINQLSDFLKPDQSIFQGQILGVKPNGNLVVQVNNTTHEFQHGEVRILM